MSGFDRSHSILQMTSPLGDDVLVPTSISGHEAISQPFSYRVQMVSTQSGIDPDSLLHQPGCVILRRDTEVARHFHGIFQEFTAAGQPRPGMYAYHAVLVPKFWFLSQTIDCRVFQDKSVVQIVQQMLQDASIDNSDFRIYETPPVRPYTVQFNETDLQFATRLMEEAGYFYFFEHAADRHTLVVADSNDAFHDIPNATLRFDANIRAEDVLTAWHRPRGTAHGKVTLKDYDPLKPGNLLQDTQLGDQKVAGAQSRDVFRWPAATDDNSVVRSRSKLMVEAAEAAVSVSSGAGAFRPLVAGGRFTLQQDPVTDAPDVSHVVRSLNFEVADESWSTQGAPAFCANSFECFPTSVPWRQQFSMPRPDMGSVHSAIVLGPEGEEIYTDDYGRVKVQFHWDYRREATADKAVWARVVQPWAGSRWGWQFIPRVGTEVAVAFMDGDVDHPVVLGGLYNGDQMPIFAESEKTKGGLRTRSTPKGGTSDYNELSFEDSKDQEMVYLQAQKDMSTKVKHDQTLAVDNDRTVTVGNAEKVTIGNGRTTQISASDDKLTVQQGDLSIAVSLGKITITALQSIELTVGTSTVRIDQTGVSLSGMSISLSGDGAVSIEAPITSISGDASVAIEGGLVEIN